MICHDQDLFDYHQALTLDGRARGPRDLPRALHGDARDTGWRDARIRSEDSRSSLDVNDEAAA
jgi:hypothetical protein